MAHAATLAMHGLAHHGPLALFLFFFLHRTESPTGLAHHCRTSTAQSLPAQIKCLKNLNDK
jgi:hypothetical protein